MALLRLGLLLLALTQQQLLQHAPCSALAVHTKSAAAAAGAAAAPSCSSGLLRGPLPLHLACRMQRLKPQQQQQQQQLQPFTAFVRPLATGAAAQRTAAAASLAATAAALEATATKVAALQHAADNTAATAALPGTAAAAAAAGQELPFRIGHGYDMHRLSTDPKAITGPLVLSGVSFASEAAEAAAKAAAASRQQPNAIAAAAAAASAAAAAAFSGGRRLLSGASLGLRRLLGYGTGTASSSSNNSSSSSSSSSNLGFGVIAHSDGDVVLHAAADAIFAASGAADIGQQFPDTAAENKGRDSRDFVAAAAAAAAAAGYAVAQLDVTLLLQRPRISSKKQQMIENLAAALGISSNQISIKAKTGEGIGPVGRSEAVECHAMVLLQRKG
ncbi:2C-methyl-D-erythritol 2,4-cyclodiphosphate synthase domain-containing protein, putative [Eimeria mitis]|uniref:2-C-methyl-D-erythritol 2,4-cyclodiphosphate synthase n=1 Tax=Eimeria mitis TaxID=44415 RepID=U6KDD6_9EIME|nr:2C-methyl-D-erythritol 2,4-cyclodiphosphate synthase domain-containing protein, putative [Eimeria mitis]CDJ33478.1 2C-methyl-D-erythritol 2,4-cyclodiphosphate synthase domain-containing protein, putative [Eimeria mitis]